ncbi:bifunctional phosphoribosylaminoimidazolecarboxamide formyltransferase/IMP cyclohydrolase [Actinomycetota bacterium]
MIEIKRALISVSDKEGIIDFARTLEKAGAEIISTGGTYAKLSEAGIKVKKVDELTGFPEMMEGRVKTLHPMVHGGILADRSKKKHMDEMVAAGILPIDMVVVNLYPFKETISKPDVTLEDAIENIDIGGPTMIRSAAKNSGSVAVIVDSGDYQKISDELENNSGKLSKDTLFSLAVKAFKYTGEYDSVIFEYLSKKTADHKDEKFSQSLTLSYEKIQDLRYGENPHQKAAYYRSLSAGKETLVNSVQLQGKELSYNNILDTNAAFFIVKEFAGPCVSVIKHNNPCGAAVGSSIAEAYQRAYECDPVSAFGSVVASNMKWTKEAARSLSDNYVEVLIAPDFDEEALKIHLEKPNLRILKTGFDLKENIDRINSEGFVLDNIDLKSIDGGMIIQDLDEGLDNRSHMKVVTKIQPTENQWKDLLFGWQIVKNVKSNAIVLAANGSTVGVGVGQMSRIDAAKLAVNKSSGRCKGSVMASDAFFPFKDVAELAAQNGILAIIQPGGSVNDAETIETCNKYRVPMVFTGKRHFKH